VRLLTRHVVFSETYERRCFFRLNETHCFFWDLRETFFLRLLTRHVVSSETVTRHFFSEIVTRQVVSSETYETRCFFRDIRDTFFLRLLRDTWVHSFISNLSDDRSTASSKTIPPLNAIDLELPPSNESILFCPQGHPTTAYVFFLVLLSLLSAPLSFLLLTAMQ
jgi:hypothetical protein